MSLLSLEEIRTGVLEQLDILSPGTFSASNFQLNELQVNVQRVVDTPEIGIDYAATRGKFLRDASELLPMKVLSDYEIFSYDFWIMCKQADFHTLYPLLSNAINLFSINQPEHSSTAFTLQIGGKQGCWMNQQTNTLMILFSTRWDWAIPSNITN